MFIVIQKLSIIFIFLISGFFVQAVNPDSVRVLKIFLVRHARVDQKHPILCPANRAAQINKQYNELHIRSFNPDSIRKYLPKNQSVVFSSTMRRAIETAEILLPEADTIITSPLFDEYSLPMASIPLVPLPYPVWTYLSRFFWISRLNSHGETRNQSLKRMHQATSHLIALAEQRRTIVVICHGYIIRDIRKKLKNKGWQIKHQDGNKNLSVTALEKKVRYNN